MFAADAIAKATAEGKGPILDLPGAIVGTANMLSHGDPSYRPMTPQEKWKAHRQWRCMKAAHPGFMI